MSAPPTRPGTGPVPLLRAARTRLPARRAAEPEATPAGPAAAHTTDAGRRTPAPSPIPLPPPGPSAYPLLLRPYSPAAPTCLPPPHPAPPAPARVPTADPRETHQAPRAPAGGPTAPTSAQIACAYLSAHNSAPAHRRDQVSKPLAFPDVHAEALRAGKTRRYGDCHLQPNDR